MTRTDPVTDLFVELNGHHVADLVSRRGVVPVCICCGERFADRLQIEHRPCPPAGHAHSHELVRDPDDELLYCLRCPMIAYDLADIATDPDCPLLLRTTAHDE